MGDVYIALPKGRGQRDVIAHVIPHGVLTLSYVALLVL